MPVDRGICCHVGGDIVFDAAGNLILATGDDTNPFESDGYTPIDERPGRNPAFDAQRSSANTNDLRGKILRITVGAGGGYTIPAGNLFVDQDQLTRPEIYLMGLRNPFRIEFNQRTGELYVADYSPDAVRARTRCAARPGTASGWRSRQPGNFGWPYCATAGLPYVDYNFATGVSGAAFNCGAPVNESPNNTGARQLPPVTQPQVWYSYGPSAEFPALGTGGIGPMAGPAYRFDAKLASKKGSTAWPPTTTTCRSSTSGRATTSRRSSATADPDRGRRRRRWTTTTRSTSSSARTGRCTCSSTATGSSARTCRAPNWRASTSSAPTGNRAPSVTAVADTTEGPSPLTVHFSAVAADPEGTRLRYAWDFDADGRIDSRQANPTHTYAADGVYRATVTVTDQGGRSTSDYVEVTVGSRPVVRFVTPTEGQPFAFGDTVSLRRST